LVLHLYRKVAVSDISQIPAVAVGFGRGATTIRKRCTLTLGKRPNRTGDTQECSVVSKRKVARCKQGDIHRRGVSRRKPKWAVLSKRKEPRRVQSLPCLSSWNVIRTERCLEEPVIGL
jgi:hypothetical protein